MWSRASVDSFGVTGTAATQNGVASPGTVRIDDIESKLGRASVRVGANIPAGQVLWQPFVTATLWREFADSVRTRQTTDVGALCGLFGLGPCDPDNIVATLTTDRLGMYAQFGIGTAFQFVDTGWLGYARVDYRTGENIEGVSVNAGLRYQFTPGPGDGRRTDVPGTTTPSYNWTGFYFGGFGGATAGAQAWLTAQPENRAGQPATITHEDPGFAGYLAGGQLGFNVQIGRWVVGIEGDYGVSNAKGGKSCDSTGLPFDVGVTRDLFWTCEARLRNLAMLTGRLGYTRGGALYYLKGGLAAGQVTVQTSVNSGLEDVVLQGPLLPEPVNGETKWLTGWTVGGGMEFALSAAWSAKAEYMYYDLGSAKFAIDSPDYGRYRLSPPFDPARQSMVTDAATRGSIARIGVNYHLNSQ